MQSSAQLANGAGVTIPVNTLSGAQLVAVQDAQGVRLQDLNPLTQDAKVTRAVGVCQSVVNIVDQVPLPF